MQTPFYLPGTSHEVAMTSEGERSPMTARDAAKELIRPYVQRGLSLAALTRRQVKTTCPDYATAIGGTITHTIARDTRVTWSVRPDQIGVSRVAERKYVQVYPLSEIYEAVKRDEQHQEYPAQLRLF